MAVTREHVEATLKSKLNPSHLVMSRFVLFFVFCDMFMLDVVDTSGGCGASFSIEIATEQFEGKRLLERHRMVNAALVEELKQIHALSITKALTPEQWKQQEDKKSQASA
ncbi:protein BOLA2 [Sesamum angolense]|uniref:Protein BOLA2 n=1 Tax=Sesamum angolense TaxID=2727404 RepID=A0AAE2BQ90_9LAMI|nr:protein BOLA2 [Sesamum angolense]